MENVNYIYIAMGAFLLGMLFIANLVRSIFAGFNRQQYYPTRQDGTDDWTGTILIVLMIGGIAYMFVTNKGIWFNEIKANDDGKEEIVIAPSENETGDILSNEQEVMAGKFLKNKDFEDIPQEKNSQKVQKYDPDEEVPVDSYFLRVNTLSDEHNALGLQYDYGLWIDEDLVLVAQDEEGKYHVLFGPYRTSAEASKLKVKYGGDVIFNPDYEFLEK